MLSDITFLDLDVVPFTEATLRVVIAIAFGLALGFDRDSKNKPIDVKAYMIVAMTTCVVAILGQELYQDFKSAENVLTLDIGKIISGTLTGLGFLGAGAIIKVEDKKIIGSATGASIWASGIIGLIIGFGFYSLAALAFAGILAILVIGGYFQGEKHE